MARLPHLRVLLHMRSGHGHDEEGSRRMQESYYQETHGEIRNVALTDNAVNN